MDQNNNYNSNGSYNNNSYNQNPEFNSQQKQRPYETYQSENNKESYMPPRQNDNAEYYQNQSTHSSEGTYSNQSTQNNIPYIPNPHYNQAPPVPPVTFGDWLLSIFLMFIPCINIAALVYWALSSTTNPSKQNLARALLLCVPISIIILLVFSTFLSLLVG